MNKWAANLEHAGQVCKFSCILYCSRTRACMQVCMCECMCEYVCVLKKQALPWSNIPRKPRSSAQELLCEFVVSQASKHAWQEKVSARVQHFVLVMSCIHTPLLYNASLVVERYSIYTQNS